MTTMTEQEREATIKALIEERRGYVAQGWADRVALVDEQLKRLGADAKPERKAASKRKGSS